MSESAISKTMTVKKFLEGSEHAKNFLRINGYPVDSGQFNRMMGIVKLGTALTLKNYDFEEFREEFTKYIQDEEAIKGSIGINDNDQRSHRIVGSLPCVVQLPLHKAFEQCLNDRRIDVDFQFQGASLGQDWRYWIDPEKPAVIMVSPGFEPLFNKAFCAKYAYDAHVKDWINEPYHQDLRAFADPTGRLRVISIIPMVIVVNHKVLGTRKMPRSWHDLVYSDYTQSLAYPNEDEELLMALLTYIYKLGGDEALVRFAKNCQQPLHPSQMVKSRRLEQQPAVMIMPYFFSRLAEEDKHFETIWPQEGAISIPIFLAVDDRMNAEERKALDFFYSQDAGTVFARQGFFPSSIAGVENDLPDKLLWLGWKYVLENDMPGLMRHCWRIFEENRT